ncbi:MAG TPA: AtpZ/AtpI family protein [Gemmatales bacterium]|nr:AtpZ/AtpI family protein [Gemmatales bacterium]
MSSSSDKTDSMLDVAHQKLAEYKQREAEESAKLDKQTRNFARIAQLSQIGMEMAIPAGIGVGLDFWLKTMPWCTVVGAILGPILGFIHLMSILHPPADTAKK